MVVVLEKEGTRGKEGRVTGRLVALTGAQVVTAKAKRCHPKLRGDEGNRRGMGMRWSCVESGRVALWEKASMIKK